VGHKVAGTCSDLKSAQVLALVVLALQLVGGGNTGTSPVLAGQQLRQVKTYTS
jgi:hypothetical protein